MVEIQMDKPRSVTPAEAAALGNPTIEVVGGIGDGSIEGGLGLNSAIGRKAPSPVDVHTKTVLEGVLEGTKEASGEVISRKEFDSLRDELKVERSERGAYGREVVGPLRKDLARAQDELEQLRAAAAAPPVQAPQKDLAEYARDLYGSDVDVADPAVLRSTQANLRVLDATERGVDAKLTPVMEALTRLEQKLEGGLAVSQHGLSHAQMQQVVEGNPELASLSQAQLASFVRRQLDAGEGSDATPTPKASSTEQRARMVVEGSSGIGAPGTGTGEDADVRLATMRERFGKIKSAEDKTSTFISLLESGAFKE